MADDDKPLSIHDVVGAAFDEANGVEKPEAPEREAPEQPEAPEGETAEQRADRERDEKGRFAKKAEGEERPTLKMKAKPAAAVAVPAAEKPAATAPASTTNLPPEIDKDGKHLERIPPPPGWKGAANIQFDRLPRPVREEIAKDYAQFESVRTELAPIKELYDANREFLINQAGSVQEATRQMMMFARMSVDNPVQLANHILRARGIDPVAAFSGQHPQGAAGQGQQTGPQIDVAQLVNEQIEARLQQQQSQQLSTEIAAFAADPQHPYFNEVRSHMVALLNAGSAKSLQEAYDQATWASPTIRAQLQADEREAEKARRAEEAAKAKKALATSVRGSPLPNGSTKPNGAQGQSAFDTARAAYEEVTGA